MNSANASQSASSQRVAIALSGLDVARGKFLDLIVRRVLDFEAFSAEMRARKDEDGALKGISALCHKISGVSETIGFRRAGALAMELELLIEDERMGKRPGPEIWGQAGPLLEQLMDELESLLDD